MPELVVDVLQAVEVDEEERERLAGAAAHAHRLPAELEEAAPIVEPGRFVEEREVAKAFFASA